MSLITQTIETKLDNAIFGYDPAEFMPVYVDNELANKRAFIGYKLAKVGAALGNAIYDNMYTLAEYADAAIEQSSLTPTLLRDGDEIRVS